MHSINENTATTKFDICLVPAEQHYSTPWDLLEDMNMFERRRTELYEEHPEYIPTEGKFEMVQKRNGYMLLPTSRDNCVLYRGQGIYKSPCLPSIYRGNRSEADIFADRIRAVEFELMLKRFDITQRFENAHFDVDYVGLAQHYGINTDVLDLTVDIRIALFFAMCRFNSATNRYEPQKDDIEHIGYIYAVLPLSNYNSKGNADMLDYVFDDKIKAIGLQPFERPGRQKGFSLHYTDSVSDINGYLYSFSYTKSDSEKIYQEFGGDDNYLWCKDEIAEHALDIVNAKSFTYKAFSLAASRFYKGTSKNNVAKMMREAGYSFVSPKKVLWGSFQNFCSNEKWNDIVSNIIRRTHIEGRKRMEFRNTKVLGRSMMLTLLGCGLDAPEGYDSGFEFIQYARNDIFGLSISMNHEPIMPKRDGKIHPSWKDINDSAPKTRSFELPEGLKPHWVRVKR